MGVFVIFDVAGNGTPGVMTQVIVGNSVFVSKDGDDATGLRERFDRMFLTLDAAKTAAAAGDTIYVYPGIYNEKDLLKHQVNWKFLIGASVVYTGTANGAIWDDSVANGAGGAVTSTIEGVGLFINNGAVGSGNNVIELQAASNLTFFNCAFRGNRASEPVVRVSHASARLNILEGNVSHNGATGKLLDVSAASNVAMRRTQMEADNIVAVSDISGGVVRLQEVRYENTNAGAVAHGIDKTGGTLILRGVTIVLSGTDGTSFCLINTAGGPDQDVLVYDAVSNRDVDGSINEVVNSVAIDSAVT